MNTTDSHDTTYGRALAYAADAIRRGDNGTAITLLTPYTDAAHDPVTYHSAYRLLYPLAPNNTLRDRLIAAAIQGDNNSYTIIADTLATLDPAILPADNILPLVRQAYSRRDYHCVLNLTRCFAIHHPNHPHIVDNYHFAALAMDKTGKSEDALILLQKLRTHYPEHTCLTDIMQTIAHHSRQRSHEQRSTNTPPATSYVLYILMQTLLGGGLAALAFAFLSPLKGGEAFGWVLLGYVLLCFPLALVCFVAGIIVACLRLRRDAAGITLSIIVTILTYVGAMALFAATTKETMSDVSPMMSTILTSASLSTLVLSIFLPAAPPTDDAD